MRKLMMAGLVMAMVLASGMAFAGATFEVKTDASEIRIQLSKSELERFPMVEGMVWVRKSPELNVGIFNYEALVSFYEKKKKPQLSTPNLKPYGSERSLIKEKYFFVTYSPQRNGGIAVPILFVNTFDIVKGEKDDVWYVGDIFVPSDQSELWSDDQLWKPSSK